MLSSIFGVAAEVGGYWQNKAYSWWTTRTPRDALFDRLEKAETFEEWEQIALKLDEILGYDLWRQNASSKHYDYRLIYERQQAIIETREDEDVLGLVGLLRAGLVRNLGNITAPRLFNKAYAGTKLLIEDYITQVALAIEYVTSLPTTQDYASGWTAQTKLDLLHDTRQAFGRSTLVLQGGAIFGICHLGVVKALHLRGLLPRIITGTATGALIAALVGIHTEDELLDFLDSNGIDFAAFSRVRPGKSSSTSGDEDDAPAWNSASVLFDTISRRTVRYLKEGYFLDVKVLEAFVQANVGDMTFLEAYARTKRVLNIIVATSGRSGVPNLLNYLTAPNVLICSAAVASNASSSGSLFAPVTLKCKDEQGNIVPWVDFPTSSTSDPAGGRAAPPPAPSTGGDAASDPYDSPLARVASLFNVNHFIVSQARPYVLPFISASATSQHTPPHPSFSPSPLLAPVLKLVTGEVYHRLTQLDECGLLPPTIRKLLLDEAVPSGSGITLVPSIGAADYLRLLDRPGREEVEYWIRSGERSVWPAVSALRVRCAVEVELERGYQMVRRRKPLDGDFGGVTKVEGRVGR